MHNLTNYTEKNKQSFLNTQREHRKCNTNKMNNNFSFLFFLFHTAIAPFINQLRDLHNLYDDIQKKIQKRLLNLKITNNDQTEFLQTIFNLLHENENLHLIINQLNENEFHIEIQDQQIQHLSSIIFRYQYSTPCLESSK